MYMVMNCLVEITKLLKDLTLEMTSFIAPRD